VAGFFKALADGDAGAATGGGLRATVEDLATRLAPLAFVVPEAPAATVCLGSGAPLETIHRALAALREAGVDGQADIVLLDDGSAGGEVALLPAVVRNLRYARVPAQASALAARNEVARTARGPLVVWLAPQVRVMPGWLEAILATFAREPDSAAVGSKVVRDDGLLHHTGILLGADGTLRDPGWLAAADNPEQAAGREVHGFGDVAFALRRDRMAAVDGFAAGFASPTHAAFDLCMRLRERGGKVLYQPLAVALWSDEGAPAPAPVPDLSLQDEDSRRLRQRWVTLAPAG
jgi:GT2 family glycosyltransferase